jgi:hypothetical protein
VLQSVVAPKVFKEPRGGSHLHLLADQLTLDPSTCRSAHPQKMAEWRKAPSSIPGDIVSGSQNGQDRCAKQPPISARSPEKRGTQFCNSQKLVAPNPDTSTTPEISPVLHPHPLFQRTILFRAWCPRGGSAQKKEKDWHLTLSPWPIIDSYCSTSPPPIRAGKVGGIVSLCRMYHAVGAPHQQHTRFSRVNRHVIKWAGKKHRKSVWGTNILLAQYFSYTTASTALQTGKVA